MNNTIRVSARIGYLKIMDLFIATSIDYNPKLEEAYTFFKIVQNKLHYVISGLTATNMMQLLLKINKSKGNYD